MRKKSEKEIEYEELIHSHEILIYKVCRFYYHNFDDIQDLYQEILIRLWRGFTSFKGKSDISTWIYRVSLNTAISHKRTNKSTNSIDLSDEVMNKLHNIEEDYLINELYQIIDLLSPIERSIIFLYLEGKSYQEIAFLTGYSTTNIGTKIMRIKDKMTIIKHKLN